MSGSSCKTKSKLRVRKTNRAEIQVLLLKQFNEFFRVGKQALNVTDDAGGKIFCDTIRVQTNDIHISLVQTEA